jgi:ATP-dependent exoDNAse (exonuclease V) beta subunit
VTPDTLELFLQIQPELNKIDNIHAQEVALFSDTLKLAGRVDCVGEYNGKLSIIDFKGSTRSKNREDIQNYFQQATAYAIMWQEMTGVVIENFAILVSCEDGEVQVFEGHPLQHVRALKEAIDYYQARL